MTATSTEEFEEIYERIAEALDRAGRDRETILLLRLTFLLARALGDAARVRLALAEALDEIAAAPLPSEPPA